MHGSPRHRSCSLSLVAVPRRHRQSLQTPPAGSRWPRPSTSAPRALAQPESWSEAAAAWELLDRTPLAAYCRWREAESLVAVGASRTEASRPLRQAHAVAARIGAQPLLRELDLLAQRARLDPNPSESESPDRRHDLQQSLGLTRREAEVLSLVARGYTNREIADALVISIKTASVHVSHILRKLDAPNRREAAAIAHRLSDPPLAHP